MQSAAQFQPQPLASGLSLVETETQPLFQIVGVSAAWRKLLVQAEMAAPHLQVATLEGEHGTGKHTLARYLFARSPLFLDRCFSGAMRASGWPQMATPRHLPAYLS